MTAMLDQTLTLKTTKEKDFKKILLIAHELGVAEKRESSFFVHRQYPGPRMSTNTLLSHGPSEPIPPQTHKRRRAGQDGFEVIPRPTPPRLAFRRCSQACSPRSSISCSFSRYEDRRVLYLSECLIRNPRSEAVRYACDDQKLIKK